MQAVEQRCSLLVASLLHALVQQPQQAGDYL
jgi:hypothetical protein